MCPQERPEPPEHGGVSRRGFLSRTGVVVATTSAVSGPLTAEATTASGTADVPGEHLVTVRFKVNGTLREMRVDPRWTLLDVLRERLELTGTKKGCDRGQCGACTVHVDGRRVVSCLTLAATLDGHHVTTIEGLADGDELHPMQQAFLTHDGFQCGFCTPGQIMSAVCLAGEGHTGSDDEIREYMSGNICRCSAYPFIVDAVKDAQGTGRVTH